MEEGLIMDVGNISVLAFVVATIVAWAVVVYALDA